MDEKKVFKVVFAGGGTGGHIYPGIAVADSLSSLAKREGLPLEIHWIGNKSGMDKSIVQKNLVDLGGSIDSFWGIPSGKLRRYVSFQNFIDIFKIIAGFLRSLLILRKIKPDCLFSKGGFVSVPPCFAAKILGIPYFTHECDFTLGLATRLNSKNAKKILVSYKESSDFFSTGLKEKCVVTGNPVRPVFYDIDAKSGLSFLNIPEDHQKPILLVLGGSLGALQINNLIKDNIEWLTEHFIVVHQTGRRFAEENPDLMHVTNENWKRFDFIYKEMPSVLQCADIILSRSGANSIWECAVCKKPMVLIPLCGSGTRGDQVDNARFFEKNGAALVLVGDNADSSHLKENLTLMLSDEKRAAMSASCESLIGDYKPSERIAEIIMQEIKNDSTDN